MPSYAPVDDQRVGSVLRAVRRRRGLRQADVAMRAGVAQATVSRVEHGHLDLVSLRTLRSVFATLDVRLSLNAAWRGADLDRLIDEDHVRLVAVVARTLASHGWETMIEVTYSRYGEHGSIDILAAKPDTRTLLVVEIKTQLVSVEETVRRLDQKHRLASSIALERLEWRPVVTGRLLVLPNSETQRRRVRRHAAVLDRVFPVTDARVIRHWLNSPSGAISALWFASFSHRRDGDAVNGATRPMRRVRPRTSAAPRAADHAP